MKRKQFEASEQRDSGISHFGFGVGVSSWKVELFFCAILVLNNGLRINNRCSIMDNPNNGFQYLDQFSYTFILKNSNSE